MKRWRAALLVAFLAALPILFAWNRSPSLLEDSDTKGILTAIREAQDPLKWFRGDWPIANHFYRPIASLTFEIDNAIWGTNAAGYGLTNALLCFGSVLLLFWFLREVTDRPWYAAAGAATFALWHNVIPVPVSEIALWIAYATLLVGLLKHRRDWRAYLPAFLTLLALSSELNGIVGLRSRMIDWIPGRTASTMTVFALAALAAYARYERLRRSPLASPEITPQTPPATRNTVAERKPGIAWPWAVLAILSTMLALGSYEQAVMLPAVLGVVAIAFRIGGNRPNWPLHGLFWGLLFGYLILRWKLLPHDVSGYQKQQLRFSQSVFWSETEYLFPPLGTLVALRSMLDGGFFLLLDMSIYRFILSWIAVGTGYYQARREPALALVGWAGSSLAFLPMAWVKLFEHYHYWPMALRAGFVVALGAVAFRLAASAWRPPVRPAPPRRHPAPGSLPHP